jgi:hypothetical protein
MEVTVRVDIEKFKKYQDAMAQMPDTVRENAAQALWEFLVDFHENTDWKEDHWFPGGRSGEFAKKVVEGWQPPRRSGGVIQIQNTFGLLTWKTTGGVITPQRATHLTIPLIPAARGKLVAEYSSGGNKLFRAGDALCRKIGKKIEAVYALSLGVRQNPYPKAMPTQGQMNQVVREAAKATAAEFGNI